MADVFEGGCHCTAARYTCSGEPDAALFCHCRDCQRTSGSPFSTELMVARDTFEVSGTLTPYVITTEFGDPMTRWHCPTCGSGLYLEADSDPVHVFVKVGTLDDASRVTPTMHIFTKYKQPWLQINDGLPQYDAYPEG